MKLAFLFPVLISCLLFSFIARAELAPPLYETSFSVSEGFVVGPLHGQQGWSVDHGSASVDEVESENAVVMFSDSPRTRISRNFTEFTEEKIVFLHFHVLGGAGEPPSSAPEVSSPNVFHVALVAEGDVGRLYVFDGDGVSLVASNQLQLSDLPSFSQWRYRFPHMGHSGRVQVDDLHIHHIVDRSYQRRLGIPETDLNRVPGFVIEGNLHTPSAGTLTHRLREVIGNSTDEAAIIGGIRQVYQEHGYFSMWAVTEKWLISKGFSIP